jgi:hypothetical protein
MRVLKESTMFFIKTLVISESTAPQFCYSRREVIHYGRGSYVKLPLGKASKDVRVAVGLMHAMKTRVQIPISANQAKNG